MPVKIAEPVKSSVIQRWLQGKTRDDIARENGLSSGAVSTIVSEWRLKLGLASADELRELGTAMNKAGISAAQCALGFRAAMIMTDLGVKEENFDSFILDIYNRCKSLSLSPKDIAAHLKDLLEFSKTIPLSQIPEYINLKKEEKKKLEEEIEKSEENKKCLEAESSKIESLIDEEIRSHKMTTQKLRWISHLKLELAKHNIPLNDLEQFVKVINGINNYGYNINKVINEFSDLNRLTAEKNALELAVQNLENTVNKLKQEKSSIEQALYFHNQTLSVYNMLDRMQFGLKELKQLRSTIIEIGIANNMSSDQAIQKFYMDLEHDYDNKLGFESKLEKLRLEIADLSRDQTRLRSETLAQPLAGPMLVRLIQRGITEQDIVDITHFFERNKAIGIEGQKLSIELDRYGSIRSAIEESIKENDSLKMEQESLQIYKQDIHKYYQSILFELICLQNTASFYHSSADSLKKENMILLSIIGSIYQVLCMTLESGRTEKLNRHDYFVPLIRASAGEAVSTDDIKLATDKALEIASSKIDPSDKTLTEALSSARFALKAIKT
jgi:hypothetical protein